MADESAPLIIETLLRRLYRWPTGITTLIGLLVGAVGGLLIHFVPLGVGIGVAVGVGIDSLMNNLLNHEPEIE